MKPRTYCACTICHGGIPVDVTCPVGTATACSRCIANHKAPWVDDPPSRPAFEEPQPFEPPRPADATGTTEDEDDGN